MENLIKEFNKQADIRTLLLSHPDQEMVKMACKHFLGDKNKTLTLTLEDLEKLYQAPPENSEDESAWASVYRMGRNSIASEFISKLKDPNYESD